MTATRFEVTFTHDENPACSRVYYFYPPKVGDYRSESLREFVLRVGMRLGGRFIASVREERR